MIIQLNPPIPMNCPKGDGVAILLTDYGCEYDHIWTIAINSTGELWSFSNRDVRMQKNITMNRNNENLESIKQVSSSRIYDMPY